jgi:predicted nuclease of predicted toxin-antitoxin system
MPIKIAYYTDEHVSGAVVKGLRLRGVDVLTCQEAGMLGATDEEHLVFASANSRVVFSQDTDFLRIHTTGFQHAGIVYAAQQTPTGKIISGLLLIWEVLEP